MRRRISLAVLVVLALAVVAVILIGDTGGRDTEATKGKPFIGSAGVTRSVASIRARQRFVERHPSSLPKPVEVLGADDVEKAQGAEGEGETQPSEGESEQGEGETQPSEGESEGGAPQRAGAVEVKGQKSRRSPSRVRRASRRRRPGRPPRWSGPAGPRSGRGHLCRRVPPSWRRLRRLGLRSAGLDGSRRPDPGARRRHGWLRVFDKSGNQNPGELDVADSTFWDSELPPGVERPIRESSTTASPSAGSSPRSTSRARTTA